MLSSIGLFVRIVVPNVWAALRAPVKPKSYPLPKCSQCGTWSWALGPKYLHERWFGTGVNLYMPGRCNGCGLNVKFRFQEHNYNITQKMGWYFE